MGLLIDTGVFIRWERSGQTLDFSPWKDYGAVSISAITASELLVGVWRADSEPRRNKRSVFVESVLARVPIIDFSLAIAREHARLNADLMSHGEMIGAHDLILAATGLHTGAAVLTTNFAEFSRVPGLTVLSFTA